MPTISARRILRGASVGEAEALWYALARRPAFVDGFASLDVVEGEWPQAGSRIAWTTPPGGRARVVERVTAYAPGSAQVAAVEDAELRGTQTVRFTPAGDGCEISVELSYRVKREGAAGALADLIHLRRGLRASFERTLARLAIELAAERELHS